MSHALLRILGSVHQRGLRMSQPPRSSKATLNQAVITMLLWMIQVVAPYLFQQKSACVTEMTKLEVHREEGGLSSLYSNICMVP